MIRMKKQSFIILSFLLVLAGMFTSCEEVEKAGKYDNWRERNEAFIDSLNALKPVNVFAMENFNAIEEGQLFKIQVQSTSTTNEPQYIYCKKITKKSTGDLPIYTSAVSAYYYGTTILGDKFDGNFTGYTALDKTFSGNKEPNTEFDVPADFSVSGLIPGWTTALQYMLAGERWMLYIPWQSAYGSGGNSNIMGYSTLAFDIELLSVNN